MTKDYPEDVLQIAWAISARHLVAGQKDVTLMIADAIVQERRQQQNSGREVAPCGSSSTLSEMTAAVA